MKPLRGPEVLPRQQRFEQATKHAKADEYFEAIALYAELIEEGDPPAEIVAAYAMCLEQVGRMDEAARYFRQAVTAKPLRPQFFDNLVFCLDHATDTTKEDSFAIRREWWDRYGRAIVKEVPPTPHTNNRDPERPLRVGYVGGDFRSHSASFSFHQVVLRHSEAVQPFCYFTAPIQAWDEWSSIYSLGTTLRHVWGMDAVMIADLIRDDQIDILVDLAGHSGHGRLDVFCLKPAPVSVHAWGYILGTGLDTVDYVFGDPIAMPYSDQPYFSEKVVHLPCIVPFVGAAYAPPVMPLPSAKEGGVTFGAFSSPRKINPATLRLWGEIVRAVPGSRLLIKIPLASHAQYQAYLLGGLGVEPSRVIFEGYSPHDQHLAAWNRVDLALDPYPAAGGVSLAEGLWQGVPHVTRVGDRVVNRIPASIYSHLGLEDFIATTAEDYVKLAIRWATEGLEPLARWRSMLREAMFKSPLAQGYVEAVEVTYRDLFRGWARREVLSP